MNNQIENNPYIVCGELEASLNENQRNVLDYIMMEFLTVPESDNMTVQKLQSLMLFIIQKTSVLDWYASVDSDYVYATKQLCKNYRKEILDIVN
jgi:hypothetical protein